MADAPSSSAAPEPVDAARTCGTCWFGETPKVADGDCRCCQSGHFGGHFDLDGNPQ